MNHEISWHHDQVWLRGIRHFDDLTDLSRRDVRRATMQIGNYRDAKAFEARGPRWQCDLRFAQDQPIRLDHECPQCQ
ncbi:MAG: hypothetical protein L0Y75_04320 [Acidobacteria bacterium]|nr:hypothetical protein [Acidobacteriota bacterium]